MSTTPSAGSASEDYSPRSSPSRPNTASVPSYLPNQAAHTSPVRNKTTGSDAPFSSYRQSPWRTMTSPIKFEVSGFSGTGSKRQHSTFALQPSTLKQQSNEDEMHDDGAQVLEGPPGSWQRPLVIQETRNDDFGNPNDGLPLKDWEGLEARYEQDMEAAIQHEQSILDEIEWVMKVCDRGVCDTGHTDRNYLADDEGDYDCF